MQSHESKIKIKDISKKDFENIISEYKEVTDELFKKLTGGSVPDCLSGDHQLKQSFLSEKMKDTETLQEYTLKKTSKNLILSKRAQK